MKTSTGDEKDQKKPILQSPIPDIFANTPTNGLFELFLDGILNPKLESDPPVSVKHDSEKEFMEFDIDRMVEGEFYKIEYQGELQLVKKISDSKIAFYDVIE